MRDEALGKDARRVRGGSAPQAPVALHNAVHRLLWLTGVANVAAAVRHHAWSSDAVVRLVGHTP
jgi:hypothetical protein